MRKSKAKGTPSTRVAIVSPEIGPFAKTGGLADMVGTLSLALEAIGLDLSLIMPAYCSVLRGDFSLQQTDRRLSVRMANSAKEASVLKTTLGEKTNVYFIREDGYFDREQLYSTSDGDYPDNAERFIFFARAALELLRDQPPDVLHCHDWQSALAIVFLKNQPQSYPELASVKTVLTVHNLGFQGLFDSTHWPLLNLEDCFFAPQFLEFYGRINVLKGAIIASDKITTVSPTYAREIMAPEQGFGLEGVLQERARDVVGILNGADYTQWGPESDPFIPQRYGRRNLSGKKVCKAELQRAFGLAEEPRLPLIGMVSRMTIQKGFDLLELLFEKMLERDLQFVLLGNGERRFEERLTAAAARFPQKAAVRIGFDEALAHRIEASADLFLMPSLYEPCGLNQIYSLKYGTIPIVRATGGLKDTVEDYDPQSETGTGFVFGPYEPAALLETLDRALSLYAQRAKWTALIRRAMAADFSWHRSAEGYDNLYRELTS